MFYMRMSMFLNYAIPTLGSIKEGTLSFFIVKSFRSFFCLLSYLLIQFLHCSYRIPSTLNNRVIAISIPSAFLLLSHIHIYPFVTDFQSKGFIKVRFV